MHCSDGSSWRDSDKGEAESLQPGAKLFERGGRAARGHGQGGHGAVARPAGTGDRSLGGHRRSGSPGLGPTGTEGGGLCPHRGQHRGKASPGSEDALGTFPGTGVGVGGRGVVEARPGPSSHLPVTPGPFVTCLGQG